MLRTVLAGIVALALAVTFLMVVLLKVPEPVLLLVAGIGVLMMIWNIVDAVRATSAPAGRPETRPEDQQERQGVS